MMQMPAPLRSGATPTNAKEGGQPPATTSGVQEVTDVVGGVATGLMNENIRTFAAVTRVGPFSLGQIMNAAGIKVPQLNETGSNEYELGVGLSVAVGAVLPTPAGKVKAVAAAAKETITVGRWMSKTEHSLMANTGKVQESFSGTTHVASPSNIGAFMNQAAGGSRYIQFNVPVDSIKMTNQGWAKIIGPNSLEGRLANIKGNPVPQMPAATDISWIASKLY